MEAGWHVVFLAPGVVLLTGMPACKGNAVWLTGSYSPSTAALVSYGKRKFPQSTVWCAWEGLSCCEILHWGASSIKREVHKQLPGVILLCLEGRNKKNHFFQILPFQLKPQDPWCILSQCFHVSDCLFWILPELLQRSTISTQFILLQCHAISYVSCSHQVDMALCLGTSIHGNTRSQSLWNSIYWVPTTILMLQIAMWEHMTI